MPGSSETVRKVIATAGALIRRIPVPKPWQTIAVLTVGSWAVTAAVAVIAEHNGRLYSTGGQGVSTYAAAWALGHGHLPAAHTGYLYALLLAPIAALAGPNLLGAIPAVVVLNAVVLTPAALCCIYGLARRVAGRAYATVTSTLWVVLPVLAIPDFYQRYRQRYVSDSLPSTVGLVPVGILPSLALLLLAAVFCLRAAETRDRADAIAGGLTAGLALAVDPANAQFLPAAFAALLVARTPRAALAFAAALLPAVLGLAIWKLRGDGNLPTPADLGRHVHFDRSVFNHNLDGFREFTWSVRLLSWVIVGGVIALTRRSAPVAVLVGGWFAAFLLLRGGSVADFDAGTFFPQMAAAFPALFLLIVALPLLVPVSGRGLAELGERRTGPATGRRTLAILGALTTLPLLLVVMLPAAGSRSGATVMVGGVSVPANTFTVTATTDAQAVTLSWPTQSKGDAQMAYTVVGGSADPLSCRHGGMTAAVCTLAGSTAATTSDTTATVKVSQGSPTTYRVVVAAAPFGEAGPDDSLLLSSPVTVPSAR